jgi:hypothetical protein
MLAAWPRSVLSSPHCLLLQDLSTLEPAKLTPLSPEVISRQATINIGECRSLGQGRAAAPNGHLTCIKVAMPPGLQRT